MYKTVSLESSDQNEESESDDCSEGRLQQLQRESMQRLDRLKLVVDKMREVREQRHALLLRLREEMDKEDKDAEAAGQDDIDILGDLKGSEDEILVAIKKKLDDRYGKLVRIYYKND